MEYIISELIPRIAQAMPSLTLVDEDYGQLENIDDSDEERQMYPITFPCVLIDAPETEWSNLAPGGQKGITTVRVRLCIDCYDDTHYGSDTVERADTRNELRHQLHTVLQGFRPAGDGCLVRTAYGSTPSTTVLRSTRLFTRQRSLSPSSVKKRKFAHVTSHFL